MVTEYLESVWDCLQDPAVTNKALVTVGSAGALVLLGSLYIWPTGKDRPRGSQLSGGSIHAKQVQKEFDDYSAAYGKEAGEGILDRSKTGQLVDTFYNLVTGGGLSTEVKSVADHLIDSPLGLHMMTADIESTGCCRYL